MTEEQQHIEKAKLNLKDFKPLYLAYHKQILLFCYQRVESKSDAKDICAKVFLKAMNSIKKYEDRGVSFGAWLYRIAFNEIHTFYKKNQRVVKISEDFLVNFKEESKEEPNELIPYLAKALKKLKPITLRLIEMRFWENRPFKEIAEIMELTESNAKVKTYRGLEKLKEELEQIHRG